MKAEIPTWAMRPAGSGDRELVGETLGRGTAKVDWPDRKALRDWARRQGWSTPWLDFEQAFLARMLEDEASFEAALGESGLGIRIPKDEFAVSEADLAKLDALYEARSPTGRPTDWGLLVESLREIRRAVEAGVVVQVAGGPDLRTWQGFYDWAHGRYHMLEDGSDRWIGDDS
jgi:hypothetical protein